MLTPVKDTVDITVLTSTVPCCVGAVDVGLVVVGLEVGDAVGVVVGTVVGELVGE